ncbi:glycosyltransferase [Flavobacterium sp. 245]|uniref:glycosyltransferase n=1 Tax=Flavobacterium sp. 245 TaxID=2512115 RepID=UPI00105C22E5|nr:glycosyltransferase [Flavobacterium sp. 245]TDO96145.1 glycosyltransferase involved in cell wall biosynthesis [Flavobacterium sp. 245]
MTIEKRKIALIGDCLAHGGAEKVHALLSIYFHNAGLKVVNIVLSNIVTYEYHGELNIIHTRSEIQKTIQKNKFDYIIDFRARPGFIKELMFSWFIYPTNVFYTVHSGLLDYYFPRSVFLSKLIYKRRKIVTVSQEISYLILSKKIASDVHCINNPIDFEAIEILKNEPVIQKNVKYILAIGRLEEIKQFDELILAYANSILPEKGIKLFIVGSGSYQQSYKELSVKLGLGSDVEFTDFLENPYPYYKNALFTVLCSKNEGLSNVLLESLACSTPVISFDCFCGPNEIILDKYNGLLVENQNFKKLTEAIDTMFMDKHLYRICKENSLKSVEKFSLITIGKQWLNHFALYSNFR